VSTSSGGTQRRRRIAGERRRPEADAPAPTSPPPAPSKTAAPPATEGRVETPESRRERKPGSWRTFTAAAVAALLLIGAALWLGLQTWSYPDVRNQDKVERAERSASSAAERAATAILSFKYTTLDADLQASTKFMTSKFADTFTGTFESLAAPNAKKTKATVVAKVLSTAVVTASDSRAEIMVFVDQTTTSTANSGQPSVALNRTTFDMVKQGDTWLVDDFHSY
jgi:Mce-associated membrane protein